MPGRTHGVHAEPLSLGVKLANHYDEVRRGRARLAAAAAEVAVGQVSGPVGTHTSVPPEVEEHVCQGLGLGVAAAATQVLARDRHAAFVAATAILGASLERLATTVRLLQQTEVAELEEPFAERQKGSSAMPHKHNPVLSERVCGMARVLRGHAVTAIEDVALWHERDISHSSAERIVLPDSCALLDYMLRLCTRLVLQVRVNPGKMLEDVETLGRITCSPRVLDALIVAGRSREDAYREVQALAERARGGEAGFEALVRAELGGGPPDGGAGPLLRPRRLPRRHRRHLPPAGARDPRRAARGRRPRSGRSSPSRRGSEEGWHDPGADGGSGRRAGGVPAGQGARHLRPRRRQPADGGDRPPLRLRRRPARPHPREGPDAHPDLALVVRADVRHIVANHLLPDRDDAVPPEIWAEWRERSMRCARAERIDVECVVRGHLSGSGWKEYRDQGTLAGEPLPSGLRESSPLPELRFTPATKNDTGHDVNISRAELAETVGVELAGRLERTSLELFRYAAEHCRSRGIILADTKFEFGMIDGRLCLIDEVFTPNSSRFWEAAEWREGQAAVSFDKQPVRDYLETLDWDKRPPGPQLPPEVIAATTERYLEAARRICGLEL